MKQKAAVLKQQAVKTNSVNLPKKLNKPAYPNNPTTRSMPASPSLSALGMTIKKPPTSVPNHPGAKVQKLQAIRYPLIHFLAARPASAKLLSQNLSCKQDEILEVLQKVGKEYRLDPSKWDLSDKTFKELDVWAFPYPSQEDRQLAINRAISAFDRMRLSVQEGLWQSLLPKYERGKGKILSHLANLNKGPIQQISTPRIHVQEPSNELSTEKSLVDNESDKDRLAPSDAEPMARSRSHDPIKKKKISEKEAQSKRLLSSGPKKVMPAAKVKLVHPAVKKGGKKPNAPKSSEFVNESDEEDGLANLDTTQTHSTMPKNKSNGAKTPKAASYSSGPSAPKANGTESKTSKPPPSAKSDATISMTKKDNSEAFALSKAELLGKSNINAVNDIGGQSGGGKVLKHERKESTLPPQNAYKIPKTSTPNAVGSTAMQKSLSRQRTTSSPHKPSPLGSSPPTNASDLESTVPSSTSSTPPTMQVQSQNSIPNVLGHQEDGHTHKTSEHILKRKADDLDSDIHTHETPYMNGNTDSQLGNITGGKAKGNDKPAKRRKDSSDESSAGSDSSGSPSAQSLALEQAHQFKRYYARYEIMYREVSESEDVSQEKIETVKRMHNRLVSIKDEISKSLVGAQQGM